MRARLPAWVPGWRSRIYELENESPLFRDRRPNNKCLAHVSCERGAFVPLSQSWRCYGLEQGGLEAFSCKLHSSIEPVCETETVSAGLSNGTA